MSIRMGWVRRAPKKKGTSCSWEWGFLPRDHEQKTCEDIATLIQDMGRQVAETLPRCNGFKKELQGVWLQFQWAWERDGDESYTEMALNNLLHALKLARAEVTAH